MGKWDREGKKKKQTEPVPKRAGSTDSGGQLDLESHEHRGGGQGGQERSWIFAQKVKGTGVICHQHLFLRGEVKLERIDHVSGAQHSSNQTCGQRKDPRAENDVAISACFEAVWWQHGPMYHQQIF